MRLAGGRRSDSIDWNDMVRSNVGVSQEVTNVISTKKEHNSNRKGLERHPGRMM